MEWEIIDGICTIILCIAVLCILVRHIQHQEKSREKQQENPYEFLHFSAKKKKRNNINRRAR